MYFRNLALDESMKFTLKNAIDILNSDGIDKLSTHDVKIAKTSREFEKYYQITNDVNRKLVECIDRYNEVSDDEVLDLEEIDKFYRLKLRMSSIDSPIIKSYSKKGIYLLMYRMKLYNSISNKNTKYTMPFLVNDKYVLFITFDENNIKTIQTITCDNTRDATTKVRLSELNTKGILDLDEFKIK